MEHWLLKRALLWAVATVLFAELLVPAGRVTDVLTLLPTPLAIVAGGMMLSVASGHPDATLSLLVLRAAIVALVAILIHVGTGDLPVMVDLTRIAAVALVSACGVSLTARLRVFASGAGYPDRSTR